MATVQGSLVVILAVFNKDYHLLFNFKNVTKHRSVPALKGSLGEAEFGRKGIGNTTSDRGTPSILDNFVDGGITQPYGFESEVARVGWLRGRRMEKERFVVGLKGGHVSYRSI